MEEIKIENIYFDEPRLKLRHISRFFARLISYSLYSVLIIGAITFFLSEVDNLFWLGILISLFLIDRALHFGEAERSIVGLNRYFLRPKRRKDSQFPQSFNTTFYLAPAGLSIIERAFDRALIVGGDFYLYLIEFLTQLPEVKKSLIRMDVNLDEFNKRIEVMAVSEENRRQKNSRNDLLQKAETILKSAFLEAVENQNKFIESHEIFAALGSVKDEKISRLFNLFDINPKDLSRAMIFSRFNRGFGLFKRLPRVLGSFANNPRKLRHRIMNRAWTSRPTPVLDEYGVDFTDLARKEKVGFLIGHKNEYARLIDILSRLTKPNALLVGEAGSGKETIIGALAFGLIKDEVSEIIFDKRLVSLKIGDMFSGAAPEEFSGRLKKIVEEIILAGNIILYLPDVHNLTKTVAGQGLSAADILLPIIENDAFPVVGATYPKEFKEFIESKSDFCSAFETIRVDEISENEAVKVLTYESLILERQYKITVSFGAIKQAVSLARKYFHQKPLPSGAEDLLKESISYANQKGDKLLQADDVIAVAERKINIPIRKASKEEAEKLLNLENIIHENLIDQEQAVSAVSRALREYRSGLSRKGGPIASFLFVGPTGVGKTELSKILAKIQFGSEEMMARFDMSEYQNKENISRLIGSNDGKIAGSLTESIIQKPYSLILLDEFEKANPDILNLFLQVFDDGRLTDSLGRTVDFTNTVIIATSNAHSNFIKESIEAKKPMEQISEELKKKLTEYFKPELLNRFSKIVFFKNLSSDDIEKITRLQLKSLTKTLEETHGVVLDFDEAAVKHIAELGYDPVFGARPLRGVISDKIKSVLAEKILKGEIVKGGNIKAVLEKEELKFL